MAVREHVAFAREATQWLTLRHFDNTADLIIALRAAKRKIWVTDLSQHAVSLDSTDIECVPPRLAICFGTELSGASVELLAAADKRVYLRVGIITHIERRCSWFRHKNL